MNDDMVDNRMVCQSPVCESAYEQTRVVGAVGGKAMPAKTMGVDPCLFPPFDTRKSGYAGFQPQQGSFY